MSVTPQNIGATTEQRLADGDSPEQAFAWLQEQGVPEQQAVEAVQKAHGRRTVTEARSQALRKVTMRIVLGIVVFLVGVVVTAYTYMAAEVGERFTVLWGAIVVGIVMVAEGLWRRAKVERMSRQAMAELA